MKKTSIFLLGLATIGQTLMAQVPRKPLYEEFTGENCGPCASTNPALNVLLNANTNSLIAIKWQVPIPSAPSTTWSLYQTNKGEINWRYKPTTSPGYGYPQTLGTSTANYINSAPNGRMDGQELNAFGLSSNHPFYLTQSTINTAISYTTPFSITMNTSWNSNFTSCVVNVSVTAASNFTSTGALMFRTVLVERLVSFPTPPGSNGEKDFYDPVRKCYSTVASGTTISNFGDALPTTWTAGQTQTLSLTCAIPSYIYDQTQMAFVGFIQDDGNRKIWQSERTPQPSIPNEAKAVAVTIPSVGCTSNILPTATIKNNGANAITAMTITPYFDGVAGANIIWTGNLSAGTTTVMNLNSITPTAGSHTYSYTISGVSGGDIVTTNNSAIMPFLTPTTYFAAPVVEGFVGSFPPPNWTVFNLDNGPYTFSKSTLAGGYGTSSESVLFQVNSAANGDIDDMYLPPSDLTGITNPQIAFDFAYCQVSTSNKDSLGVFVSTDCGSSWNKVYGNGSTGMATAPVNSSTFFQPTATQWSTAIVPLTGYANASQVLVKFQVKGNKGNRLFIDNINLGQMSPTGVKNNSTSNILFDVYPNPAENDVNVFINTTEPKDVKINVISSLGQLVYTKQHEVQSGANDININLKDIAPGIYFVTMTTGEVTKTQKLVITK